jgi:hypothetical protein
VRDGRLPCAVWDEQERAVVAYAETRHDQITFHFPIRPSLHSTTIARISGASIYCTPPPVVLMHLALALQNHSSSDTCICPRIPPLALRNHSHSHSPTHTTDSWSLAFLHTLSNPRTGTPILSPAFPASHSRIATRTPGLRIAALPLRLPHLHSCIRTCPPDSDSDSAALVVNNALWGEFNMGASGGSLTEVANFHIQCLLIR